MLSSTSSSKVSGTRDGAARRACTFLIAMIVVAAAVLEIGTRKYIYVLSADLGRIHNEMVAARAIRKVGIRRDFLFVGNSLLLWGVDIDFLNRQLMPLVTVRRFAIQQTTFYDWYFGIRRLLNEGARPDSVVLALEPRHLVQSGVSRGALCPPSPAAARCS